MAWLFSSCFIASLCWTSLANTCCIIVSASFCFISTCCSKLLRCSNLWYVSGFKCTIGADNFEGEETTNSPTAPSYFHTVYPKQPMRAIWIMGVAPIVSLNSPIDSSTAHLTHAAAVHAVLYAQSTKDRAKISCLTHTFR